MELTRLPLAVKNPENEILHISFQLRYLRHGTERSISWFLKVLSNLVFLMFNFTKVLR